MSRVGKLPIAVPKGVDVTTGPDSITVKGSLGTLVRPLSPLVSVKHEDGKIMFAPTNDTPEADAMSGTMRALVNNMVGGVTKGFDRQAVGQIAAEVRAVRPPEPYKGKGIRYAHEKVTIKETKKK